MCRIMTRSQSGASLKLYDATSEEVSGGVSSSTQRQDDQCPVETTVTRTREEVTQACGPVLCISSFMFLSPFLITSCGGGDGQGTNPFDLLFSFWSAAIFVASLSHWCYPVEGSWRHRLDRLVARGSFFLGVVGLVLWGGMYAQEDYWVLKSVLYSLWALSAFFYWASCKLCSAGRHVWVIPHVGMHTTISASMLVISFFAAAAAHNHSNPAKFLSACSAFANTELTHQLRQFLIRV